MASRKCYRYTFEVFFPSKERKASFSDRIEAVQQHFEAASGVRGSKMNNFDLLSCMVILAEEQESDDTRGGSQESRPRPDTRKLMNRSHVLL